MITYYYLLLHYHFILLLISLFIFKLFLSLSKNLFPISHNYFLTLIDIKPINNILIYNTLRCVVASFHFYGFHWACQEF